jgi:DNA-directed RNA polymerase subunit RPC12/RpoP
VPARIPDEVKAAAFANAGLRLLESVRGDSKTKLRYECKQCGHRDKKHYNSIQMETGCPKCAMRGVGEMKRWTLEKAREVFKAVGLTLLSTEYEGTYSPLDYVCDTCGHRDALPSNKAAQGRGCKACGLGRKGSGNRLTREEVEETLKSKSLSWVSGEYKTGKSVLKVRCDQCASVFDDRFINLDHAKYPCEECRVHIYNGGARPPKYSVADVAAQFEKHGLILLEATYLGYDVPHQYRCKTCGYENGKRPSDAFQQATGCKKCGHKRVAESHRLTAAEYEERFRKRGVAALEIPTIPLQEVGVRCLACGREDRMSLAQLERSNPCTACNPPKYVSIPVEEYRAVATKFGGQLLKKGQTSKTNSLWKCELGHTFPRSYNSIIINNSFCNVCTTGFQEMLAKTVVEMLFGQPFVKTRIAGSRSIGGKTLEVDLYNELLGLAVEMNGFQHYQPVDFTGKGREAAEKSFAIQKENDRRREQACRKAGITLVVVRELGEVTPVETFRQMIAKACQRAGIPLPKAFWSVSLENLKPPTRNAEYWQRAVAQAAKWGLRPEANEYTQSLDRHWWLCEKGCRVPMRPTDIVRGRVAGCPECYKKKHYKPVELSDGRVFRSGADAARALGMKPSSIYWAMSKGKKVCGVMPKLISLRRYEQIIAAERPR